MKPLIFLLIVSARLSAACDFAGNLLPTSTAYAQYFNGYGESLRDYRANSEALRVGFALVR